MESTGVYWIPAFEILVGRRFDVILVNARYAKNVPWRKTDVSDAAWLMRRGGGSAFSCLGVAEPTKCHVVSQGLPLPTVRELR